MFAGLPIVPSAGHNSPSCTSMLAPHCVHVAGVLLAWVAVTLCTWQSAGSWRMARVLSCGVQLFPLSFAMAVVNLQPPSVVFDTEVFCTTMAMSAVDAVVVAAKPGLLPPVNAGRIAGCSQQDVAGRTGGRCGVEFCPCAASAESVRVIDRMVAYFIRLVCWLRKQNTAFDRLLAIPGYRDNRCLGQCLHH